MSSRHLSQVFEKDEVQKELSLHLVFLDSAVQVGNLYSKWSKSNYNDFSKCRTYYHYKRKASGQKWCISWEENWLHILTYCTHITRLCSHSTNWYPCWSPHDVYDTAVSSSRSCFLYIILALEYYSLSYRAKRLLCTNSCSLIYAGDSIQVRIPARLMHWFLKKLVFVDLLVCCKWSSPSGHIRVHNTNTLQKRKESLFTGIQKISSWHSLMKL